MTLASKVLIGFIAGIASGVFFVELIAPVGIVGDAFIRRLRTGVVIAAISVHLASGFSSPALLEANPSFPSVHCDGAVL